jgi:hypothetical protein
MTRLPHFNPDDDGECLAPAVEELRWAIGDADAVVFCTPEYAGALPGSFKNLLDWTVGGAEMYRKPVAWINVAAVGRGDGAQASLSTVLGYLGSDVVAAACHTGRSRRCGRAWRHRRRWDSRAPERNARRPAGAPCRRVVPRPKGRRRRRAGTRDSETRGLWRCRWRLSGRVEEDDLAFDVTVGIEL